MKSLHICYISQEYPPETGWGGIGSYTYEMAHALADAGHHVTVISRALERENFVNDCGIGIHRVLAKPNWSSLPVLWRLNRIWPGFAWAAMLKLREIHRKDPIDIVEAAEGRADGFFVSYLPRRPKLVTRLHTARIFVDHLNTVSTERARRLEYWLEKKSILRANLLTAPSKAVVDLTRTWLSFENDEAFVVPNPVDEKKFRPSASERKNLVVYTGRLERKKGVHVIAEAIPNVLKRFPSTEFLFVGSDLRDHKGTMSSDKLLNSLEPRYRQQVRFEQRSRDDLVRIYQEAAVCVLPSMWENFPYALLEAMACGAPVVATKCGGCPELIEDNVSGFLVPVNDAHALASRIVDLLADPLLRQRVGHNARTRVEEISSPQQVLPKMIAAYHYAIANS